MFLIYEFLGIEAGIKKESFASKCFQKLTCLHFDAKRHSKRDVKAFLDTFFCFFVWGFLCGGAGVWGCNPQLLVADAVRLLAKRSGTAPPRECGVASDKGDII